MLELIAMGQGKRKCSFSFPRWLMAEMYASGASSKARVPLSRRMAYLNSSALEFRAHSGSRPEIESPSPWWAFSLADSFPWAKRFSSVSGRIESFFLESRVAFQPGRKNADVIISGERRAGKIEVSVNRRYFWLEESYLKGRSEWSKSCAILISPLFVCVSVSDRVLLRMLGRDDDVS